MQISILKLSIKKRHPKKLQQIVSHSIIYAKILPNFCTLIIKYIKLIITSSKIFVGFSESFRNQLLIDESIITK